MFDLQTVLSNPLHFFGLKGFWGQPLGSNFPSPWATILALRLDCSTAGITTPQTVLPLWRLVELKMLDFSDGTRTGISNLTSAADLSPLHCIAFQQIANKYKCRGRVPSLVDSIKGGPNPFNSDQRLPSYISLYYQVRSRHVKTYYEAPGMYRHRLKHKLFRTSILQLKTSLIQVLGQGEMILRMDPTSWVCVVHSYFLLVVLSPQIP